MWAELLQSTDQLGIQSATEFILQKHESTSDSRHHL